MKRLLCLIIVLLLAAGSLTAYAAQEDISLAFTDPKLRQEIYRELNKKEGDVITAQECLSIKELAIYSQLDALDGIAQLANLEELYCIGNGLTAVDVSKNTKLSNLCLDSNRLQTLDVSALVNLKYLSVRWNELSALNVSANTALESLECNGNQLSALDLTNNPRITNLSCCDNLFTSEQDVKGLEALQLVFQPESSGIYPLPATVEITQMPTKSYVPGTGEPSLKGLELTLTSGDFTRSVRYNDLKTLHKHWTYMKERKNPDQIWNFHFDAADYSAGETITLEVSYGVIWPGQTFDSLGGSGLVIKYTCEVELNLETESVLDSQKAKVLKPGKSRLALVTSTEEENYANSLFGNPLFSFTAPEDGEYQIVTSGVPKRRSYWIDLIYDDYEDYDHEDYDYEDYDYDYDDYDYDYDDYDESGGGVFQTVDNEDGLTNKHPLWLEKGETIYLRPYVSPNDEVSGFFRWDIGLPKLIPFFTFLIKVEPVTDASITLPLNQEVPVQLRWRQRSITFAFTPEEDGNYTFYSSGSTKNDPYATVPFDWVGYEQPDKPQTVDNSSAFLFEVDGGESGSYPRRESKEFKVNMNMVAGQTYYLTVSDRKWTADYTVKIVSSRLAFKAEQLSFKMYELIPYEALFAENTYEVIDVDKVSGLVFLSSDGFYSTQAGTDVIEFSTPDGRFCQSITFTVAQAPKPSQPYQQPLGDYPEDDGMGWIMID